MLYNIVKKKVVANVDCLTCENFDKFYKKCNGIGKSCFEYDKITNKIVDPVTKKTIKVKEN
jgi:hypothetical protein